MDFASLSDLGLLRRLIGTHEAKRLYGGKLTPLFASTARGSRLHQRLGIAHELVKRLLLEEIKRDCVLKAPEVVKQYLRGVFFAAGGLFEEPMLCAPAEKGS